MLGRPYEQDDRVVLLANFLADYFSESNIEIEAKVGTYRFKQRAPRVSHITLLDPTATPFSFQSSVDENYFNSLQLALRSRRLPETSATTEDLIYEGREQLAKERKTIDPTTQDVLEVSYKARLYDLNFLINPDSGLGIRISANKEYAIDDISPGRKFVLSRRKQRTSFTFEYLRVDMTTVQQRQDKACEVEMEIADAGFVRQFVEAYRTKTDRHSLFAIANKFWQNALALAQYHAKEPTPVWSGVQAELRTWVESQHEVYREGIGSVMPLLGDYLYTVARERCSRSSGK